ncbi:hypothetical protein HU200_044888 [Digitaria exilis]|uniref:Uncharacterized protein n=1 Tax=Digitaria exilis TaxID=1010633 RepID=A0A835B1L9_9POAL|nr:hypothetical protein HU200_044888 [Digitaria exilis]CAB3496104.1 unnamed protein product [Digitaria exilis]
MHPPPQPQPEPANRRSSSSTTCSTAPRRTIGCMAGLLRLISPYHRSHHRKRLIAKLQNAAPQQASVPPSQPSSPPKKKAPPPAVPPLTAAAPSPVKTTTQQPQQQPPPPTAVRRRRSCDAPRSPTIAPEHRRSSCDSPRPPPPAIVARLMGLEESAPPSPAAAPAPPPRPVVVLPTRPPPPPPAAPATPETAAEKRRKLLGALEKCDEDLKTLRRIIAAVRAAEMRAVAASPDLVAPVAAKTPPAASKAGAKWTVARDEHSPSPSPLSSQQQQYPSPDSVLDAISSPRFPCRKRPSPCTTTDTDAVGKAGCGNGAVAPTVGSKIVKPSRTLVFSGGDYWRIRSGDELQLHIHCPVPVVVGMPRSAGAESWRHHRRRWEMEAAAAGRVIRRAMAESAGEATMWGAAAQQQGDDDEQSRERGRVVATLEGAIVQDLVAELLSDLLALSGHGGRAGCRKRLCF